MKKIIPIIAIILAAVFVYAVYNNNVSAGEYGYISDDAIMPVKEVEEVPFNDTKNIKASGEEIIKNSPEHNSKIEDNTSTIKETEMAGAEKVIQTSEIEEEIANVSETTETYPIEEVPESVLISEPVQETQQVIVAEPVVVDMVEQTADITEYLPGEIDNSGFGQIVQWEE